jgi:GABA(A) receptor-associated protein
MTNFKNKHTFEKRLQESSRILEKYPERIPVIVEKAPTANLKNIDKNKYLVPSDLTVGQFIFIIRKRLALKQQEALFIFINNILPPANSMMSTIYKQHQDKDGFLYIIYSGENTFGI